MVLTLEDLPTEVLHLVLQDLPISDLFSFARSSRSNYEISTRALTTLDLAVFPRKIHSLLAFFDTLSDVDEEEGDDDDDEDDSDGDLLLSTSWATRPAGDKSLYQIGLITPTKAQPRLSRASTPPFYSGKHRKINQQTPIATASTSSPPTALSLRTAEITSQNDIATTVLQTPALINLRSLTLRLYDLTSPTLATTLASFTALHSLSLDFFHPYIHDTTLPTKYWKESIPSGTPIWNSLAGVGTSSLASLNLHSLRSLRLTRSGITSCQLQHWIMQNPFLRSIDLRLVRGVDEEFTSWLATYLSPRGPGKLESIHLTDCPSLQLTTPSAFAFITDMAQGPVRDLSLRGCRGVNEDIFLRLVKGEDETNPNSSRKSTWSGIARIVSPGGVIVRHRASKPGCPRSANAPSIRRWRGGSVSPALTASDGTVWGDRPGTGKIEVDPAMEL